jgi:hypothetical protein
MKGAAINLGYWLKESIAKIARHQAGSFTLWHCNLIITLFRHLKVPETFEDPTLYSIKATTLTYFYSFEDGPIGAPARANVENVREEEDVEMREIDQYIFKCVTLTTTY